MPNEQHHYDHDHHRFFPDKYGLTGSSNFHPTYHTRALRHNRPLLTLEADKVVSHSSTWLL